MKYVHVLSRRRQVAIALIAGGFAALVVVMVAVGLQAPPDEYAPYGISADDATALTGESRELWEADLALHQTAKAGTPGPRGTPFDPPYQTPMPAPTGFVHSPNPGTTVAFSNAWYGVFGSQRIGLFAGYSRGDEATGVFVVSIDGQDVIHETFSGAGPLNITFVSDGVAHITGLLTGISYSFDVGSMTMSSPTPPIASPSATGSVSPAETQTPVAPPSTTATP